MLPKQFLSTKLLPPRLSRKVLQRPRLLDRMYSSVDQRATIIAANAGSGKTTLAADFVRASRTPFIWYQIDPTDVDLSVFFTYLAFGFRKLNSSFGRGILGFVGETDVSAVRVQQLADIFVNEVAEAVEEKTILVLDDFHHLDGSQSLIAAIDRILERMPDVLHLVIVSRSMPNLSATRLLKTGPVGVVDRNDLLFTKDEVQRLFDDVFGRPLPNELLDQFYRSTEGWITALQLIQQSLDRYPANGKSGSLREIEAGTAVARALRQSEIDIFDYFAAEVLSDESYPDRMLMGRLSLLERIEPATCVNALGTADASARLRLLSRRNVFVVNAADSEGEGEFRLQPLFRGFLNKWILAEIGKEAVNAIHLACAEYYESAGRWELALHHYTEAGASSAAAELLSEKRPELLNGCRFELIKRTFEGLPENELEQKPGALIARADVAMAEEDQALALELFERASALARERWLSEAEADGYRGQAHIARVRGDYDRAVLLASSAITLAPEAQVIQARCHNTIGICELAWNQTTNAIEHWMRALEAARNAGDDRTARIVLHNLGLPYSIEGDLNEALRWLVQMIEPKRESSPGGSAGDLAPFPQEAIAHLNIGRIKIVQGQLDSAESHLKTAFERCQMFHLTTTTAETLEAFGNLWRERNEYERALSFYDEAERAYRNIGLQPSESELLDERAVLYLRAGHFNLAEQDARNYFEARRQGPESGRAYALITLGRIALAAGRLDNSEPLLRDALSVSQDRNLHYHETLASTSLARVLWKMGSRDEAISLVQEAARTAATYDYSYWMASEAAEAQDLFSAAIEAGVEPALLSHLSAKSHKPVAKGSGASGQVAPQQERYDLTVQMLGPISVCRGPDEPLPDDCWKPVKSLHILCYLASRRNHRASKDSLISVFWSDAEPLTVAKNFHPTISRLRKALNEGQFIKKDFILYSDGAYQLNPRYRYSIDTEEFDRLIAEAKERRRQGESARAADLESSAVQLYKGDFLEECYYDWADELQSYYRDLNIDALEDLVTYNLDASDYPGAIRYAQMILYRDQYREEAHCWLMEAYVRLGNRGAAIAQFDSLRNMLRRDLGVEPLPATIAKYESLIK